MWKTMRSWIKKGFSRKDAIDKALDYGIGMIKDAENKKELGMIFKDISSAYNALGDLLLQTSNQENSDQSESSTPTKVL